MSGEVQPTRPRQRNPQQQDPRHARLNKARPSHAPSGLATAVRGLADTPSGLGTAVRGLADAPSGPGTAVASRGRRKRAIGRYQETVT
jgi:hypothetical protein